MEKGILLSHLTETEFSDLIRGIIREEVAKCAKPDSGKYLTKNQVAEIFGVTLHTITTWNKEGKLKAHRIGTKVFYKEAELGQSLKPMMLTTTRSTKNKLVNRG